MVNPIRIIAGNNDPEKIGLWCSALPEHWYFAIRLKWANDYTGLLVLEQKLIHVTQRVAKREKWRVTKRTDCFSKIAKLAVLEVADPVRFSTPDSWKLRAAYMGVDSSSWYRVWRRRYEVIYQELNEWSNRGFRFIRIRQLRDIGSLDCIYPSSAIHETKHIN